MKICKVCGQKKPLADFYKHHLTEDGLDGRCKGCMSTMRKKGYVKNKERVLAVNKQWRDQNAGRMKELRQKWAPLNRDKLRAAQQRWKLLHPEWRIQYRNLPKIRLRYNISRQISLALQGKKSGWAWEKLVGYTIFDLASHLEKKFKPGMSWGNYGDWHIDHERPVASFEFNSPDDPEFKKCFSLNNLQPLWATENMAKGARYEDSVQSI